MSQPQATLLHVSVAMDTDMGQRKQNQDAIGHLIPDDPDVFDSLGQIFVLADGVSDLARGDLASQFAVSTILSSYYEQEAGEPHERLARAIAEANTVIYDEGQESGTPMATAVVAAVVRGRDLVIGSVGDSPAYLMRGGEPRQLTLDHPVTPDDLETEPPDAETGAPADRRVRALGIGPSARVDIITGRVRDDDVVVLCSDGLMRYVTPQELEETVVTQPAEEAVKRLIALAKERGGADNISVIVLRLSEDVGMARLPPIPDPLDAWGRPRRERPDLQPEVGPSPPAEKAPVAENLLLDLWKLVRGNTMVTGIGMSVALVIFVIIMIALASFGGDGDSEPKSTPIPPADLTATTRFIERVTAEAAVLATQEMALAATQAEIARLTLTPPTPVPTSGPQMETGVWFRVLPGDPLPAYAAPDPQAERLTDLEADNNYRVSEVDREAEFGPWYQVVDNLGIEVRWVSGPRLHARIVAIDEAGNPLPPERQPLDVPPPGGGAIVPTPAPSRTPAPPLTPGASPAGTPTSTTAAAVPYGVESWDVSTIVILKADLDLCRIPQVTACNMGAASAGEIATIVAGPVPSGEHWWWEVEFQDGRSGWIAQVLLTTP